MSIMNERKTALINYYLPTYREIPSVGLYLDQTSKYINDVLGVLPGCTITNSMISNYVKHHILSNPVKKQYSRDQIAGLIFITLTKKVLPLEDIGYLLNLQKEKYDTQTAYEFFSKVFESYLHTLFSEKRINGEDDDNKDKRLVRRVIITAVNQMYLEEAFASKE